MGDDSTPLARHVSTPDIENIWSEGDACCEGVANRPLDPEQLPDGCEIVSETEIGDGKRRFRVCSTDE